MSDQEPQPGVPLGLEKKAVADRILAGLVADRGAPSLDHYRRVYAIQGLPWPGNEQIRRLYPVADAALSR